MDSLIDDLVRVARRCERASRAFEQQPVVSVVRALKDACASVGEAWSGSWLGYQANVYIGGLRPRRPGEHFDTEWGGMDAISNRTTGEWCEYPYEAVHQEILRRAGSPDLDVISEAARAAEIVFKECKAELVPALDAVLASGDDKILGELRKKAQSLKDHFTATDVVEALVGKRQFVSRDMRAMQGGVQAPHHVRVEAWAIEEASYGEQAAALGEIARHALRYLEKRKKMKGQSVARTEGPVFIGHGRSGAWKDLKSFLVERLHLDYEEFNRAPTAGRSTKERLLEMLDRCCFAFLVMTAEDEQVDGTKHPRLNVVHEAGLFQGRYGFERAIVLLEDGCEEFTNIEGLGQVRFPPGNIMAASEDVRRVLEREGILTTP